MRAKELKLLLKAQIGQGSNPDSELGSIFVWGPPGIGKSRIIEDTAKELGVGIIDIRLLLCDPTDLRGIPMLGKDEDGNPAAVWMPPAELPRNSKGFILLDDFPTAPPLVQGSAYQLTIRPHRLGEYHLPEGWVIIGAGNRVTDRSLAHVMPAALANRFTTHIELEVNTDDWVEWAVTHSIRPEIIAFISKFRPEMLFRFSPEKNELSFPTPRTWEFTSRIMNTLPKEIMWEAIKDCIGEGATIELKTYMEIWTQLPDLDKILEGENTIPESIDLKYACCVGLVTKAKEQKHYDRLIDYSLKLEREYTVFLIRLLFQKNKEMIAASKNWSKFAKTIMAKEKLLVPELGLE